MRLAGMPMTDVTNPVACDTQHKIQTFIQNLSVVYEHADIFLKHGHTSVGNSFI